MENTFFNIVQETTHQENDFLRVGKKFIQANKLWSLHYIYQTIYMGAKKKVEVPQPPPQVQQEKPVHVVYSLRTHDGAEFKVGEELLAKYSSRLRSLA